MDGRVLRVCTMCGYEFITRCTNAKYCDNCRPEAAKRRSQKAWQKKKEANRNKPKITYYICKRCGSHIKAHGVCTNRKICSRCLESSNTYQDKILLEHRKDVLEEVIE